MTEPKTLRILGIPGIHGIPGLRNPKLHDPGSGLDDLGFPRTGIPGSLGIPEILMLFANLDRTHWNFIVFLAFMV